MEYRNFGIEEIEDIKRIYADESWLAYLRDDEKLTNAFNNSLYILGAFEEGKLIGFIRCVGDTEHVMVVQDLIVDKKHQRMGIGSELLDRTIKEYHHVRLFMLLTDANDERDNLFYQAKGMKAVIHKKMIAYMR